ncbi:MAG: DUF4286 family protein [Muribaculaceae bacterium]|nr:DUF4286 family protein [Muribaculaceae bacterium]MDE6755192.1 DUF4286 family protein [Muribaculaceae bacterium]
MVIYNITFVIHPSGENEFLEWMRGEALAALFNPQSVARNPRLQTVVEAGGERPSAEHGLSIALQSEFVNEEEAHEWHDNTLPPVLGSFTRKFGPHSAFFTTLLSVIPL